jgi:hypothetical protein
VLIREEGASLGILNLSCGAVTSVANLTKALLFIHRPSETAAEVIVDLPLAQSVPF